MRVDDKLDEDIDYSDIPELTDEMFAKAGFVPAKQWPCKITPDTPSGFFVQFIDIEEAFTNGSTTEEALSNASEVLKGILILRFENNIDIPKPSEVQTGQYGVIPFATDNRLTDNKM